MKSFCETDLFLKNAFPFWIYRRKTVLSKYSMELILTKHTLAHIPDLKVGQNLLSLRFTSGCSVANCNGVCCKLGVFVDIKEREKILNHAELIHRYMEPHQEHNPLEWFDQKEFNDSDFPSGQAVGTKAKEYGCVFLDSAGRCTLQKVCIGEGLPPYFLKPFYCVAFPITIDGGVLMIDDVELENRPPCCIISLNGTLNVFDVCSTELEFVLGKEGVEELKTIYFQIRKIEIYKM